MATTPDAAPGRDAADTITVADPASGETIGRVRSATTDEIDRVLRSARDALDAWSHTRLADRHFIYLQFVDNLRSATSDLASLLTAETGQPIADSRREIDEAASYFTDAIGESNAFYGRVYPHGAESITASFLQYTVNEPLGVIAAVMDDETPALSFAYQVASSLLAGNALVVSPSRRTPLTVQRLIDMLHEAGMPPHALQSCVGSPAAVEHLVGSPLIDGLNVHGDSTRAITATEAARGNLTRVVALGHSNDALIVFDDADLELAAAETARAGFANAGQNRAAPKRILVQRSVQEAFTEKLLAAVGRLAVGAPADPHTDVGCLIDETTARRVVGEIAEARDAGARVLVGGSADGAFVAPTVLELPDASSGLAVDRVIRGPVLSIVGFDSDRDAYTIAGDSPYGIGVGVFTTSMQRAGAAAARLAGTVVVINGAGDYRGRRIPFGGVKKSGVGGESLLATPQETTEVKTILAADVYEFSGINEDNPVGRHT